MTKLCQICYIPLTAEDNQIEEVCLECENLLVISGESLLEDDELQIFEPTKDLDPDPNSDENDT